MSKYVFILRKKDIEIELSAPDKDFIAKQMCNWQESIISSLSATNCTIAKSEQKSQETREPINPVFEQVETPNVNNLIELDTQNIIDNEPSDNEGVLKGLITNEFDQPETIPFKENVPIDEAIDPTEEAIKQIEKTLEVNNIMLEQLNTEQLEVQDTTYINPMDSIGIDEEKILENISLNVDEITNELADETDDIIDEVEIIEIPTEIIVKKQPSENIPDLTEIEEQMLQQVASQSVITEEDKATDDEFEDLIAAMSAEVEQETKQQPPIIEPIHEDQMAESANILQQAPVEEIVAVLNTTSLSEEISDIEDNIEETSIEDKPPVDTSKKQLLMTIEEFISTISIKTPVDVLLGAAFYMEKFENMSKFTTKDISARTVKAIKKPISPNIVLACVNKGYIEVVPDFTGTAESNEYTLTEQGKQYILNQLS